ncbi:MAG: alkaline phosphatase family protein [Candidatus Aenigmarchaeota archaeon]|nr:alkaline phosphatase family protein [Candidatus Aenigmarchaeota archaeon]
MDRTGRVFLFTASIIVCVSIFSMMAESKEVGKQRVLVIGIDAATWDLLNPWIEDGQLPNIAHLAEEGAIGNLTSVLPVISPAAWTSFATGTTPAKHGVFGYQQRREGSYENYVPLSTDAKAKWFWEILGEHGKRSVIINMPGTYPPGELNGILISGEVAVDIATYPPELAEQLKSKGYSIESKGYVNTPKDEFLEDLNKVTDKRAEIGLEMMESEDWDLFFIVFTESDRIQHYLWDDMENKDKKYGGEMLKYFQRMDSIVGEFVDKAGNNTTTFVVSDHGAGRLKKRFYLDKWLEEQGYLVAESSGNPLLKKAELVFAALLRSTGISEVVRNFVIFFGGEPEKIKPPEIAVDLANSKAFSSGYYEPAIYINRNIVSENEREKLAGEIVEKLRRLKDGKTGQNVFIRASRADEIYNASSPDMPDIFLESNYNYSVVGGLRYPWLFESGLRETGTHRIKGIFIASGKGVRKGVVVEDASLIDVAPAILGVFGIADENMEGKVPGGIFEKS